MPLEYSIPWFATVSYRIAIVIYLCALIAIVWRIFRDR